MKVSELSGQLVGGGRYRLLVRLGSGNFGTVYRAQELMDGSLVRDVALKLYSPDATRMGNVEGMLQDCALPARVLASDAPIEQKRHFVQIYGFGRLETPAGECAYVAMELIRGGDTLEDIVKRYRRSERFPREETIVGLMRQFFTALALAHREGVLHRDIKGANVMVENGVVRVMDFGMGAYLDQPEAELKTTMSIYAPENFEGRYTVASDIYQAGLMFYELYTGHQPFENRFGGGDMLEERRKRLEFTFRPGRSFLGAQPSEMLDAVLARCLAYAEAARYASAREVLDALQQTDVLGTAAQAAADGNHQLAERLARQTLAEGDLDDERRIRAMRLLARTREALGDAANALDVLKEALDFADRSGVYFHLMSERNALIDDICRLYQQRGQGGMARIFAQKKK